LQIFDLASQIVVLGLQLVDLGLLALTALFQLMKLTFQKSLQPAVDLGVHLASDALLKPAFSFRPQPPHFDPQGRDQ
jgi:hypothetical protein